LNFLNESILFSIKTRFGDLEANTIVGKDYKVAIVIFNNRASGVLKMKKTNT